VELEMREEAEEEEVLTCTFPKMTFMEHITGLMVLELMQVKLVFTMAPKHKGKLGALMQQQERQVWGGQAQMAEGMGEQGE
jgi:hypothetical protein